MTIFAKNSASELLEEQIEQKEKKVVGRVMKPSPTYVRKMSKLQILA